MSPAANVPSVELCPGVSIPVLGLGTWKGKDDEMALVVKDAVDLGYRHIDTAWVYENEKGVGAGIAAKIADGTVKREDLFVVTKVCIPRTLLVDHFALRTYLGCVKI